MPPPDYRDRPDHFLLFEKDRFYIDPLVFRDNDSLNPRLDLYISIPSENIIYKKTSANGNYELSLNILVTVLNSDSDTLLRKLYDVSKLYSEKEMKRVSEEPEICFYSYPINPGKYKLDVKISDRNSKNVYTKKEELEVKDLYSDNFSVSSVMVLSGFNLNPDGTKEISPLISNNISRLNDVYIFFEAYSKSDSSLSKELVFKIKNSIGAIIKEESGEFTLENFTGKFFRKILSRNEIIKHKPDIRDFDEFDPDDKNFGNLTLEIYDKQSNKLLASKKLSVLPDKKQRHKVMQRVQKEH
jgi:hypothetical protein